MICPVMITNLERWFTVFWCGIGRVFTVEEKGVCKHVNTTTLKTIFERGGYVQKW